MKIMWLDEPVEARVEFPRALVFPLLRAISFRGETVEFSGPARVDSTPSALLYRASAGAREYTVRFEVAHQRWVLEAVRGAPSRP